MAAVDGITLDLVPGLIYGLLGPNGSGKTTLIRLLTGMTHPTEGHAELLGVRVPDRAVLARIGYMTQGDGVYPALTVEELMDFCKEFSPDDQWVLYSRVRAGAVTVMARPSDGRFIPLELVPGADFARFASPIETARAGTAAAEPMTWIVMKRYTAVGVRSQDKVGQLWAAAFFPERGVVSRPFHLSGQRADVAVLHAPLAIQ